MSLSVPPLSLYIHFPWCVQKCPYCDFNSHQQGQDFDEVAYLNALQCDLAQDIAHYQETRPLQSVFLGGGTPSLFSGAGIARLLSNIKTQIPWRDDIEITLEANPGTVDIAQFATYYQAGVNRLSLGIQSFNDQHLRALGRIHDSQAAKRAIVSARQAGFSNINLDLMFGLPEQDIAQAQDDIKQAVDYAVPHLSYYQLTLEPNTAFYQSPPVLPQDEQLAEIADAGYACLGQAGYQQYEVSAWTKVGQTSSQSVPNQYSPCQHNLNYWQYGDYLGIGAGAHSKISQMNAQGELQIFRAAKQRQPQRYLQAFSLREEHSALAQLAPRPQRLQTHHEINQSDRAFEFMLNALRLKDGVPYHYLHERAGLDIEQYRVAEKTLAMLKTQNLLKDSRDQLCTTDNGFLFLNDVLSAFLE